MQTENNVTPLAPAELNGVAQLDHLGIIKVEGEDAAKFIHGQLTNDFALLDQNHARLAAFCSPKGRMLASFVGYKDTASNIFLICHQDVIASTIKRLSMFVMRAKARLSDASKDYDLYGIAGNAAVGPHTDSQTPWLKTDNAESVVINLYPSMGVARQLFINTKTAAPPEGNNMTQAMWLWGEVRSGVATLSSAAADLLVPQMLNYESVGGVNFKKGCYPGQEVVARSQFRGTIKRRAYVVHCSDPLKTGNLIFSAADSEQECAIVVQAAPHPHGGFDAIISGQISAISSGDIHLASPNGAKLSVLTLGYDLLEDI